MTGATIDVQRLPAGLSHLTGPQLHVLVALPPDDPRCARASAAASGGDLDDVLDVLASEGMRRTPAFVALRVSPTWTAPVDPIRTVTSEGSGPAEGHNPPISDREREPEPEPLRPPNRAAVSAGDDDTTRVTSVQQVAAPTGLGMRVSSPPVRSRRSRAPTPIRGQR